MKTAKRPPLLLPLSCFHRSSSKIYKSQTQFCELYKVYGHPAGGILYLSDLSASQNSVLLEQHQIKTVINSCAILETYANYGYNEVPNIEYHKYYFEDPPDPTLYHKAICEALPMINKKLSEGQNVLVHCYAGLSRSVGIVAAYLTVYAYNFLCSWRQQDFGNELQNDNSPDTKHNNSPSLSEEHLSSPGYLPIVFKYLETVKEIDPKLTVIMFIQDLEQSLSSTSASDHDRISIWNNIYCGTSHSKINNDLLD